MAKWLFLSLALCCLCSMAKAQPSGKMICRISYKQECDGSSCRRVKATIWNLIDFDNRRYSRCDRKGCDRYKMVFRISGLFVNITTARPRGMLAKMTIDGSRFIEVATIGTAALVSYGRCMSQ